MQLILPLFLLSISSHVVFSTALPHPQSGTKQDLLARPRPGATPVPFPRTDHSRAGKPITTCPTLDESIPCQCVDPMLDMFSVTCTDNLTQSSFLNFLSLARETNSITLDEWLYIPFLRIEYTTLTTFDLTPLNNTQIDYLYMTGNYDLLSFTADPEVTVDIYGLYIENDNRLTHEGYRDLFRVTPDLIQLILYGRNTRIGSYDIGDGTGDIEFLPGSSLLTKLDTLSFQFTLEPLIFGGGQFKRNRNMREISFDRIYGASGMHKFEADALLFDPAGEDYPGYVLKIWFLSGFTDDNFDSTNGPVFPPVNRTVRTVIDFWGNEMTHLDEKHFKVFLDSHPDNEIQGRYNRFVCGQRMAWLHNNRELYEERVTDIACVNDPGNDVFTTSLIN